ncbi:hypothetical protein D9619_000181 [Psilocybe cf. subviscida]|uniref:NACHT domain-containing protein n=1 Tax=Psilocybe cf. subviscida TaxID=2480587 RepID=A0A8H5BI06_9AGAR|nr:hypothetical protein D9619_000181 [Psilocybe cf. subviscida]
MFSNSSNVQIAGKARLIQYNDNTYNSGSGSESLDEGIRLLLPRVVKGAMHNSGERFDAPTCHEETRKAIQVDILGWADELVNDSNELVTWLYGPAGAGKSAIAQTIAEKLHARRQLTASFFFSRASGSTSRGAETDLVATLAHQLSQTVPATQPHIAAAVRQNPLVFDLALRDQVDALIVAPLIAVSNTHTSSGTQRPGVIIVDGLDECRKEHDAQKRVVDALILGLRRIPHHTHKLIITSRPEHNIVSIFNNHDEKLVRRMELDNRWNPNDDIRTFLNAAFADIRRTHFYFQSHPVDKMWPGPKTVETLVRRSSGQFIYASVVLKYIKSEENYNPVTRLATILQLNNNEDRPYAELDALYHYIFSQIRGVEEVLTILSLERMYHKSYWGSGALPLDTFLSEFIGVNMDEIKFRLLPLVSLLIWEGDYKGDYGKIHYMHASLPDFLLDPSRSDTFCMNTPSIATRIVRQATELFEHGIVSMRPAFMIVLMEIPIYYANVLPS